MEHRQGGLETYTVEHPHASSVFSAKMEHRHRGLKTGSTKNTAAQRSSEDKGEKLSTVVP